jgi:hypothetical protein
VLQLRAVGDTKILLVCVDGFYVIFPDMFFSFLQMKSSYGHENTLFASLSDGTNTLFASNCTS